MPIDDVLTAHGTDHSEVKALLLLENGYIPIYWQFKNENFEIGTKSR